MAEGRAIARVVGLVSLLTVAGCHTSSTWAPLTVTVRDKQTGTPVADARVDARTLHFFVDIDGEDDPILDLSPPQTVRGVTGPDGSVTLVVIADHPVQIIAVAAGYDPQVVDLDVHPIRWTERQRQQRRDLWLDADPTAPGPGGPPRLELHVSD